MVTEVDEEKVKMVTTKAEAENSKEMKTENSEGMKRKVKDNDIIHTIPTNFRVAKPDARPEVELLKCALKKHPFIRNTLLNDLRDEHELDTVRIGTVNLVPVNPPYITLTARGQSDCAHNLFSKTDLENAVRVMRSFMALETHRHIFCSDLVFYC